ncbi:MAG: DUF4159 domain-containing protein [Limisphaerales bacterium]
MNRMPKICRRHFLRTLIAGAALAPGLTAMGGVDSLRGDRVGWARLKTPSPNWKRHAGGDPILMKFFRDETTLNIDPTWYVADANDLGELCQYPFLFSQGVGVITGQVGQGDIAEYIRRGGFVLVDACHDIHVTPDFDEFLRQQIEFYSAALPGARVVTLPATHDVYRCHFQIPNGHPPHTFMSNVYDAKKAAHGLYGLMIGSRLAGIISVCGWQCGWDLVTEYASTASAGTDVACMQMVVNIYIYAMTQGA